MWSEDILGSTEEWDDTMIDSTLHYVACINYDSIFASSETGPWEPTSIFFPIFQLKDLYNVASLSNTIVPKW